SAPKSLDEIKSWGDFIGAVNREVDLFMFCKIRQSYTDLFGKSGRLFGCGYAGNLQPPANSCSEFLYEIRRRGTGAQTDHHTTVDLIERSKRGLLLKFNCHMNSITRNKSSSSRMWR